MDASVRDFNDAVIEFKDEGTTPVQLVPFSQSIRNEKPALVIDNGSWFCRAGWSVDTKPAFSFYNLLAKQKGRKGEIEPVLMGGDLGQIEALRWMIRSPFDSNVVVQYDYQEAIFDYVFANLGLGDEPQLEMPLVLTEPLMNPAYCRKLMNELLFECYAFPYVAYGVDSMFAFFKNFHKLGITDGIVIGTGNVTTHLIPFLDGRMDIKHARRIDLGGLNMTLYLQRLLQLKYPVHAANITVSRMEEIVHGYCYYAENYRAELLRWREKEHYKSSVLFFQLPFQAPSAPAASQEEIDLRREENAQRLREMNRKRHMEKLQQQENRLEDLLSAQENVDRKGQKAIKDDLKTLGIKSLDHLASEIQQLTATIQRAKERLERKTISAPTAGTEEKSMDPESISVFVADLKEQRSILSDQRNQRRQRKQELGKRRSYASQQRMKVLTQLASGKTGKKTKKEDTFGKSDDDWLVYREINKEAGESESEDEKMQLDELDGLLLKYDPIFRKEYEKSQAFLSGTPGKSPEFYRLEVGIERFRVPEILFQPSLVGVDQMGITDTLEYMLNEYPTDVQVRLAQKVFLTGGSVNLPGMDQRLRNELGSCLPYETPFSIRLSDNPSSDAWSGAALWASSVKLPDGFLSKEDYEEKGPGYLKVHAFSNLYRVPPVRPLEADAARKNPGKSK